MALLILIATVAATLLAWMRPQWQQNGMMKPYFVVRNGWWHQLVTSGFLHADLTHLLLNMVVFLFFGPVMEQQLGTGSFIGLYFSGLVVANLPTLIIRANDPYYASLGASGAVQAVLFSYIVLNPLNNLYILFIPFGIPAIVFGVLYLIFSYVEARKKRGNVNHEAHIAGALYGVLYTLVLVPDAWNRLIAGFGLS